MKIHSVRSFAIVSSLLVAAATVPARAEPAGTPAGATAASTDAAPEEGGLLARQSSDRSPGAGQAHASRGHRFSLGVSSPTGWLRGLLVGHSSVGASLSVGLDRHHAIRANVSRYDAFEVLPILFAVARLQDSLATGRILDASLGWVYYPRRLWDGLMFEAGVLRRDRDVQEIRALFDDTSVAIESVTYAGRASLGWSWRVTRHAFIAAAVGVSVGRERGERTTTERDMDFPDDRVTTSRVARLQADPELYLRFGFTFGR